MPITQIQRGPTAGQAFGQGVQSSLVPYLQQIGNRAMLQNALEEAKQSATSPGAKPIDKLFAFMKAGAGIPGSERYLQTLLPEILKIAGAEAAQNVPLAGEEPFSPKVNQRVPLPKFGQTQVSPEGELSELNKFFPSNVGPQEEKGNLPQAATEGQVRPILTIPQMAEQAKKLAKDLTTAGIPTTPAQAMEQVKAANEENKEYNKNVEAERKQRIASQREYGNIAEEKLKKVLPNATDEQLAYFKRKGEEVAGRSLSEADTERFLAKEATKFKNMISSIKNDISPARSYNRIYQNTLGIGKDYEKAKNDQRVKLAPLLNEGLYDTARNLLAELGYYPEEREDIITDLGEGASKAIKDMPEIKKINRLKPIKSGEIFTREMENFYTPQQKEQIFNTMQNALSKDPSANLILLRREFEKKGIDWREFKDNLNELIQSEKIELNDDQFNQLPILDQPPLTNLGKILHGLKLIGR